MQTYSVSEFVDGMRNMMAGITVRVQGEVSNFKINQGRLVFFELKDPSSYITCFLMSFQLDVEVEDGMEIIVTGTPSLFKKSGRFHLSVRKIELVGVGALQKEIERLKKQLESEGLFDPARKRLLPKFPTSIAVVTSPDGAALTDIRKVLRLRWPMASVTVFPVGVQGKEAVPGIVRAFYDIAHMQQKFDTVILARGGGSLEDLQAFNSEEVCRAVFACPIPVVTGVGHERDETLVEFVADHRGATPSNAAEFAVPNQEDILYMIESQTMGMGQKMRNHLAQQRDQFRDRIDALEHAAEKPLNQAVAAQERFLATSGGFGKRIQQGLFDVQQWQEKVKSRLVLGIQSQKDRWYRLSDVLASLSPIAVLERGYSVTRTVDGKILKEADEILVGQKMITRFAKGSVESTLTKKL